MINDWCRNYGPLWIEGEGDEVGMQISFSLELFGGFVRVTFGRQRTDKESEQYLREYEAWAREIGL